MNKNNIFSIRAKYYIRKMTALEVLKKYWGYDQFRFPQADIIESVLNKNDTLALLPTGAGKSICFQVPILAQEGIGIVVSPLIALMKDQVNNLKRRGINAVEIVSGMSAREIDIALDNCIFGQVKFLYLSPERLEMPIVQERIKRMKVNLLAIDEAHCISQWGYDFRPSYLNIANIRSILPNTPVLAVTATATPQVAIDIAEKLSLKKHKQFQISFERKNLNYLVFKEQNKYRRLIKILNKVPGSVVFYVRNRRHTEEIASFLNKNNISADFYHAGLDVDTRTLKQESWILNKKRVMVATNAFGMGIDKPDVRIVLHIDLPDSLEAYYQEAGRAGRDGLKSYAVLLYDDADIENLKTKFNGSFPEYAEITYTYEQIFKHYNIAFGSGAGAELSFEPVEFAKLINIPILKLLNIISFLNREGVLALSDEYKNESRITFLCSPDELYAFQIAHAHFDPIIKTLLRSYGGLFEQYVIIKEQEIIKRADIQVEEFYRQIDLLKKYKIVDYVKGNNKSTLILLQNRLNKGQIQFDRSYWKFRKEVLEEKINKMIEYVLKQQCRSKMLLNYFGELDYEVCGQCDVCINNKHNIEDEQFIDLIRKRFLEEKPEEKLSLPRILGKWSDLPEQKIVESIKLLIDEGFIQFNDKNEVIVVKQTKP